MTSRMHTRRTFLKAAAAATGAFIPYTFTATGTARELKNSRPNIGAIGMRYQGSVIAEKAKAHGDIVAICDVDRAVAEKAKADFGGTAELYEDYREMLARPDIDVVTIGAPDHWHTKMAIDACRAGKDIYCEKPLTLTVEEGKLLVKVVQETGTVFQVGTWQRSDHRCRLAVELVRAGRIGKLQRVAVVLGKNETGGPFATSAPPKELNWDVWQGQTPDVPYIKERCHYTFRWWYEYSGGQMTDWGAHHLDIAQWAIGMEHSGPIEIEGHAEFPTVADGYNVALGFRSRMTYANGVVLEVSDEGRNGIMFEGDEGRIFVNRGTVSGKPIEDLQTNPFERGQFRLYAHDNLERPARMGKLDSIVNHMGNFFDCIQTRHTPLSDVVSQHRSVSTCHLANIAMRLGRTLHWDPAAEKFVNDLEADTWLRREQRAGYEIA